MNKKKSSFLALWLVYVFGREENSQTQLLATSTASLATNKTVLGAEL